MVYQDPILLIGALLPIPPEYTTKSGWNFPAIAFPLFVRKSIHADLDTTNSQHKLIGTDHAIQFGIIGLSYSQLKGFNVNVGIGYMSKIVITNYLWIYYSVPVQCDILGYYRLSPSMKIGFQLNKHLSMAPIAGIKLITFNFQNAGYYFHFGLDLSIMVNKYFSIYLTPSATYRNEDDYSASIAYNMKVYW